MEGARSESVDIFSEFLSKMVKVKKADKKPRKKVVEVSKPEEEEVVLAPTRKSDDKIVSKVGITHGRWNRQHARKLNMNRFSFCSDNGSTNNAC